MANAVSCDANENVSCEKAASCDAFVFKFCIVSVRLSILGIWYSFIWNDLFNIFESSASLTNLFLLTVITIADMKFLSQQIFILLYNYHLANV